MSITESIVEQATFDFDISNAGTIYVGADTKIDILAPRVGAWIGDSR